MKLEGYKHYCTVGELLDFIHVNNIPRDGKILIQRVEDTYFEGVDISGMTGKLPDGSYGILPAGSKATPWDSIKKESSEGISEYVVVWSPVRYYDDKDNLYLDAHY